mgnify:CR=1 FL=1
MHRGNPHEFIPCYPVLHLAISFQWLHEIGFKTTIKHIQRYCFTINLTLVMRLNTNDVFMVVPSTATLYLT